MKATPTPYQRGQPRQREWTPGEYTPMYSDRPDGNYSAILPNALGNYAHWILPPDKTRGGICLGQQEGASESNLAALQKDNIGLICNATPRYPTHHHHILSYVRVNVNDEPSANLSPWFDGVSERIEKALSSNVSVFVHCQMGISRSSTLVMAYLMRYQHLTLHDAYRHTKEKRPKVEPNIGFWNQLLAYEKKLTTVTTSSSSSSSSSSSTSSSSSSNDTAPAEAKDNHDAAPSKIPVAVISMLAYLHDPTSEAALEQSMIDVACIDNTESLTKMYKDHVKWNDETMKPREEIVQEALNKVFGSITEERLVWLSHVVDICSAHAHTLAMMEEDSEYMTDFWAGEWSVAKANKIIDAIQKK